MKIDIDWDMVLLEVDMLRMGRLKIQTLHNQASVALKEGDMKTYLEKCLVKSYFKFITKGE